MAILSRILKIINTLLGGNLLLILFIPLVIVLVVAAIVGSVIGAILRFFGIIPDIPSTPDDIEDQIVNAPGMTQLNLPVAYVAIYRLADIQTNVPWMLLAAMHKATTDCGRNMPKADSSDSDDPNPIGQFNFKQTFWSGDSWDHDDDGKITESDFDLTDTAKIQEGHGWGKDINEDKKANPEDANDAIISLAYFLQSKGVKKASTDDTIRQAVSAYSTDNNFVEQVMNYYHQLQTDPDLQTVN